LKRGAWIALVVAVFVGTAWVRVWFSARDELGRGVEAQQQARTADAIRHFQYAMRWYSPGAAAPRRAADALDVIATSAEQAGDRAVALDALRALRGGIRATRSTYSPFGERAAAVDQRIARLMAAEQVGAPSARGRDAATLEADHLRLLALDPSPSTGWSLVVLLGFFGWIGGAAMLITRGLDARVRPIRGPALRWGGVVVISFAAWVVGLMNA
jgi:hypothetical protein